jgi:hypothetical protein
LREWQFTAQKKTCSSERWFKSWPLLSHISTNKEERLHCCQNYKEGIQNPTQQSFLMNAWTEGNISGGWFTQIIMGDKDVLTLPTSYLALM